LGRQKKQLFTAGWLKELQQDSSTDYSYKEANNYLASLGYPLELNSDGTLQALYLNLHLIFLFIIERFQVNQL